MERSLGILSSPTMRVSTEGTEWVQTGPETEPSTPYRHSGHLWKACSGMAGVDFESQPLLREFRPAWAVHAALRFASSDYQVLPVPLPDAPSDLGLDPCGSPVLVDGSSIAQGTERCLYLVESRAADFGVMLLRQDQSDADRGALDALLSLVLSKLEAIATYVEFIADPQRSEAPEIALVPLAVRWLVRRQRSSRAAAILDAAGITTEEDAQAVATAAYRALGAVLADALEAAVDEEDEAGPFFFGSRCACTRANPMRPMLVQWCVRPYRWFP